MFPREAESLSLGGCAAAGVEPCGREGGTLAGITGFHARDFIWVQGAVLECFPNVWTLGFSNLIT